MLISHVFFTFNMFQKAELSTQTVWSFGVNESAVLSDHTNSFKFTETPSDVIDYQKSMEERLEVQTEMSENLKTKVGLLQKDMDSYQKRQFILDKFKDDNAAIQFYTGFPCYEALICFYEYIEPKLSKLQYWKSRDLSDCHTYQVEGQVKPGPKRSVPPITELLWY